MKAGFLLVIFELYANMCLSNETAGIPVVETQENFKPSLLLSNHTDEQYPHNTVPNLSREKSKLAFSMSSFTEMNTNFGFNLYRKIAMKHDNNVFFSPLSLTFVLSIFLLASNGETHNQIVHSLNLHLLKGKENQLPAFCQQLRDNITKNQEFSLLQNSFSFIQKDFQIKDAFHNLSKQYFDMEFLMVDFHNSTLAKNIVNEHIKQKTRGRIPAMFDAFDQQAKIILVNYFLFRDSDDTCLDDTIINIPFTILESGPTQIAGATGEQLGDLERRADGTSGGTDVRNDPDEEQEQPNVLLSPGTRLRSNRNRNRRARRGEHIARTIMQSASREAQLTRRTQERFMDIVHDSMKDCRRTEMELVNIMKEDVRRSAQDRQRMLQYMETMTELYRRKVDHECSLPTGQHVSVAQGTMHTSFRASPGDIPPSTPGQAVCTDFQEQPSTSYVGGQFQGNISPELFDELPPAYAPDGCPVTPTSNILDDDNTVENINRDVQNVVEVTVPPQNEGCIGTVQCVSNAGTSSLQCAVAPQQKQNKPCSSRTGRIIKKKKIFSP